MSETDAEKRPRVPVIPPRLLDLFNASAYLGLSESKVWKMSKSGELPSVRIDRSLRFDVKQLDKWIEEQMRNAVEVPHPD